MHDTPVLKASPDWGAAAQVLIDGCAHAPSAARRVDLLERLCDGLGDQLYPAFLKVLCTVGERGTAEAQKAVADALVEGLRSGRVPSGRRAAWGAVSNAATAADRGAGAGAGSKGSTVGLAPRAAPMARSSARALGPIEFLCAWHAEPNNADVLNATDFDRTLRSLLQLVSQSPAARALYCARLQAVADDPLGGTLARSTRQGLRSLALRWSEGLDGKATADGPSPVEAFLAAVSGTGGGLRGLAGVAPVGFR